MSTRSQIGFYKTDNIKNILTAKREAMLYKHWDGYPSGNLPILIPPIGYITLWLNLD